MDIKYSTDTKIEDNSRGFKLQKGQLRHGSEHCESRSTVGLRIASRQDPAENQAGGNPNPGGGEVEAARDRGAVDQEEGEGVDSHGQTSSRGGRIQSADDC